MKTLISILFVFSTVIIGFIDNKKATPTPDQALERLKAGNKRYTEFNRTYPNLSERRFNETSTNGQNPFATIIGCSDSRVPIEHVFDVGIGDLFVIRVAGNVVNTDEAGSIEYGVEHLQTPILVVLGHSGCGAVTAVAKKTELHGNIPKLVENIKPAVDKAYKEHGNEYSDKLLASAIKNNVFQSIEDLLQKSPTTRELIKEEKLKVVGAIYNLKTGKIDWLGEHPNQNKILKH